MGYAQINQRGHGIHTRQFARTFIVEDSTESRIVFVSVDAGMISHAVKRNVVRELQKKYGGIYQMDNVMISGTRKLIVIDVSSTEASMKTFQTRTAAQLAFTCTCCMI